ncbi:peptidoglycan-binding domain-containing protein [Microbaculum marinum]|uniref:Peptidoglycan-binding domain-containing protein n=1 Tax=Microbaculum marinum TaxID=1764581 RepID=A0AAW9RSR2_9HYPH
MIGRLLGIVVRNPLGVLAAGVVFSAWGAISVNALWMQDGPHPAPFLGRDGLSGIPSVQPQPKPGRRVEIAPTQALDADQQRAAERQEALTRDLQSELGRRNFYNGPLDGQFGPQTESAILSYEAAAGLAQTGRPTEALLAHVRLSTLNAPPVPSPSPQRSDNDDPVAALLAGEDPAAIVPLPPVQPSATAPEPSTSVPVTAADAPDPTIEAVQTILADLGYAPGSIDGQIGPSTKRAIEDFEVDRGLPMTGRISKRLLEELSAVSGVPLG